MAWQYALAERIKAAKRGVMSVSVAEWLDGADRYDKPQSEPPSPALMGIDNGATSAVAVALCMTTPLAISLTPRQRDVFRTLCRSRLEEGVHTLLPEVMDAFVWVARQPWWDQAMAVIYEETQ